QMVPIIEFAEEVSRRPIAYDRQTTRHQFAFKNTGARPIINVRLKARLRIKDPRKRGSNVLNYYDIALSNNELFELKPDDRVAMSLDFHNSTSLNDRLLDPNIIKKLVAEILTLDDVLDCYPDAVFYIQVIGTDIYSHATKVFQSKLYARADIRNGVFEAKSLNIAPLKNWGLSAADFTEAHNKVMQPTGEDAIG
ncbi:MAG: hypothetical protein KJO47_03945, partial [Gammaproteobacteria bacterium]|nr:hypothetical protein [Gammaproteobacteria bacterium]